VTILGNGENDEVKLLLFGGTETKIGGEEIITKTFIMTTVPAKPMASTCHELSSDEMTVGDRFYHNQYFPVKSLTDFSAKFELKSEEITQHVTDEGKFCNFIGIVGRHAFHIFDVSCKRWVSHCSELGYQTLANQSP